MDMAIADINAAGGVMGKKLKVEVGDDACDPKQARAVAEKLAGMKLPVVIGHFCSSSSIPASEVYAESGVLQITPASTNPTFTENKRWNTFRVCGRDDQQGAVAGDFIVKNFKGKKVAILHDKSTYGKGLADETKKALNKAGTKETMYEAYTAGDKDFTAPRLQDEGCEHRCGLCRRLSHRRWPHPAPDARSGHEVADDLRRRVRHERALVHHRPRRLEATSADTCWTAGADRRRGRRACWPQHH